MPVKNARPFLEETWQSLSNQSLRDWELIVVNDHSDDGSDDFWAKQQQKDSRIKLFQNQGEGVLPALELALSRATGEFIGRFDADDIMPEERSEIMLKALQRCGPSTVVTGLVKYISNYPLSPGYQRYQTWLNQLNISGDHQREIYRECVVASPNWLMYRRTLEETGGFSDLEYPEDYDLCFRWLNASLRIHSLTEETLWWREHPNRTSKRSQHYQQEAFFALKIKRFIERERPFSSLQVWGTNRKAKLCAQILDQNQISFKWMAMEPKRYPNGINGHKVYDYRESIGLAFPKIIIAVYPSPSQKHALEQFLQSQQLTWGKNYWFV